jgi:transposase
VPGIGQILALVLLYEIHDIRRFPSVQDFVSYCRLVKCGDEVVVEFVNGRPSRATRGRP